MELREHQDISLARVDGPDLPVPGHQRPSFGWPTVGVMRSRPVTLHFDHRIAGPGVLRIANAIDLRTPAELDVSIPDGQSLGRMRLWFAAELQMFDLPLDAEQVGIAMQRGLRLSRVDGSEPLFLFAPGAEIPFVPQVLAAPAPVNRTAAFFDRLNSPASLAQFGWMTHPVLDALADLGMHDRLRRHLEMYFPGERIIYQDARSRPMDDRFEDLEWAGMFAQLARERPDHPAIDLALACFSSRKRTDGSIGGGRFAGEYCYSVAYPLAVIGQVRGDEGLMRLAVQQLLMLRQALREPGIIWLRRSLDGTATFRNWSRGCAWYLLGMVRTLAALPAELVPDALLAEVQQAGELIRSHQRPDGVWAAYIDQPELGAEISGSAGLAAALAIAASRGWIDAPARASAERAADAISAWLTPDGMLGGMSQSNKREATADLQRCDFRVLGQTAAGMYGQLLAALGRGPTASSEPVSRDTPAR